MAKYVEVYAERGKRPSARTVVIICVVLAVAGILAVALSLVPETVTLSGTKFGYRIDDEVGALESVAIELDLRWLDYGGERDGDDELVGSVSISPFAGEDGREAVCEFTGEVLLVGGNWGAPVYGRKIYGIGEILELGYARGELRGGGYMTMYFSENFEFFVLLDHESGEGYLYFDNGIERRVLEDTLESVEWRSEVDRLRNPFMIVSGEGKLPRG